LIIHPNSTEPFSHAKFGGYLVTRLDGYTQADAEALTTRSLQAEQVARTGTKPSGEILLNVSGHDFKSGRRDLKENWLEPSARRILHEVLVRGASAKHAEGKSVSARRAPVQPCRKKAFERRL
jgi:hypothetical protein